MSDALSPRYTTAMEYVRNEDDLREVLANLPHDANLISVVPAHGFTGYYYFVLAPLSTYAASD